MGIGCPSGALRLFSANSLTRARTSRVGVAAAIPPRAALRANATRGSSRRAREPWGLCCSNVCARAPETVCNACTRHTLACQVHCERGRGARASGAQQAACGGSVFESHLGRRFFSGPQNSRAPTGELLQRAGSATGPQETTSAAIVHVGVMAEARELHSLSRAA